MQGGPVHYGGFQIPIMVKWSESYTANYVFTIVNPAESLQCTCVCMTGITTSANKCQATLGLLEDVRLPRKALLYVLYILHPLHQPNVGASY